MDGKMKHLKKLWNKEQIFAALAIDQRGALRKMLTKAKGEEAKGKEAKGENKNVERVAGNLKKGFLLSYYAHATRRT